MLGCRRLEGLAACLVSPSAWAHADPFKAIGLLEQAHECAEAAGLSERKPLILFALANAHVLVGMNDVAQEEYRLTLSLLRKEGEDQLRARV